MTKTQTTKKEKLGNIAMIFVEAGCIFHLAIITNATLGKTGRGFAFLLGLDLGIRAWKIIGPYWRG